MPREVADRNRDRGEAIKSYNSEEMLTRGTPYKHGLAALLLLAPIRKLASLGLMAFLATVKALALGIIQQGIGAITRGVLSTAIATLGLALASARWRRHSWLELGLGPRLKPVAAAAGCALERLPNPQSCLLRCEQNRLGLFRRHAAEVDLEDAFRALVIIAVLLLVFW